jgi:hypothetical protein
MTTFSNAAAVSDTVTISSLSSLGSGSYSAPSTLIDNTPTNSHGFSYLRGSLRLAFSAALTAGSTSPYITLIVMKAADGTNLPNPPASSATAPSPNQKQYIVQLVPSASFQIVDFDGFDLDPFLYGFQIFNNSGVSFSGTVTATLYRWNVQGA